VLPERFWDKVEKTDGCWLWRGCLSKKGNYGLFHYKRATHRAHRLIYEDLHGPTSLGVLHNCDVPHCVRADHLFAGTAQQNTDDMLSKGRWRKPRSLPGEQNAAAKLNRKEVKEIRRIFCRERGNVARIAGRFGISPSQTWRILRGENWIRMSESAAG